MQLIIEFDDIEDNSKKEWLIRTLKMIGIKYKTGEQPQTLEEYNADLEAGKEDFEKGNFITAHQLKDQVKKW